MDCTCERLLTPNYIMPCVITRCEPQVSLYLTTAYLTTVFHNVRPPLSKKSFPVGQVGKKTASREVGIFLFPLISFFLKLECTGGKVKKKNIFEKMKKKVPVGPF